MKQYEVNVNGRVLQVRSSNISQAVKTAIDHYLKHHNSDPGTIKISASVSEQPSILDVTPEAERAAAR